MFTVVIKSGTKKTTLLRYLLSKLVYSSLNEDPEQFTLEDYLTLYELYFQFREDTSNQTLIEKYGRDLDDLSHLLKSMGDKKEFPLRIEKESAVQVKEALSVLTRNLFMSANAYYGIRKRNIESLYRIRFDNRRNIRKHPPERYIGVGYKDKGNAKKNYYDGNQSWQDIGAVSSQIIEDYEDPMISRTYRYLIDDPREKHPRKPRKDSK